MNKILIINGPNLNMLGIREVAQYGTTSYDELCSKIEKHSKDKFQIEIYQSNIEGEIVSKIQDLVEQELDGLIINPGAYTHTSIALRDALSGVGIPFYEVHISDIYKREEFRKFSYLSDIAEKVFCGLGIKGYELALVEAIGSSAKEK